MQNGSSKIASSFRLAATAWFISTMLSLVGCDSVLPSHTPPIPNALYVSPAMYDFAHIPLNDTVHADFYIVNGTSDSVHIQFPETETWNKISTQLERMGRRAGWSIFYLTTNSENWQRLCACKLPTNNSSVCLTSAGQVLRHDNFS